MCWFLKAKFTDDILNAMAASNQVKQLSASWSYPVDPITEQIFQQFAAQGQSFFNASGDWRFVDRFWVCVSAVR